MNILMMRPNGRKFRMAALAAIIVAGLGACEKFSVTEHEPQVKNPQEHCECETEKGLTFVYNSNRSVKTTPSGTVTCHCASD